MADGHETVTEVESDPCWERVRGAAPRGLDPAAMSCCMRCCCCCTARASCRDAGVGAAPDAAAMEEDNLRRILVVKRRLCEATEISFPTHSGSV